MLLPSSIHDVFWFNTLQDPCTKLRMAVSYSSIWDPWPYISDDTVESIASEMRLISIIQDQENVENALLELNTLDFDDHTFKGFLGGEVSHELVKLRVKQLLRSSWADPAPSVHVSAPP